MIVEDDGWRMKGWKEGERAWYFKLRRTARCTWTASKRELGTPGEVGLTSRGYRTVR